MWTLAAIPPAAPPTAGVFDEIVAQFTSPTAGTLVVRMLVAAIFALLLGWERSRSDKPADSRTMILIAIGAAGFAAMGSALLNENQVGETIRVDPTRVLSYIISGVGFLGAGAILQSKKSVKGLTTAAAIWVTAAIGAACGLGEYFIATLLFAISFVTLWYSWLDFAIRNSGEHNGNDGANAKDAGSAPPPDAPSP